MPAAGGLVPGEHPLGVMVAAVGPVMLETLPMPLVRVVGEGDPPGAVVGRGVQFVVPIAAGAARKAGAAVVCAAANELNPSATSKNAHREAAAPNRAGKLGFIMHILSPSREQQPIVENAHAIGALHRFCLCRRRVNRERTERPSSVPG